MGLAVGQQLAGKGANVVIIARDQGKLLRAIEEIQVSHHEQLPCGRQRIADTAIASGQGPPDPTLPSASCRLDSSHRIRPRDRRDRDMELRQPARYRVVLRREFDSGPVH